MNTKLYTPTQRAKDELSDELMHGDRIGDTELESILDDICQAEDYYDFLAQVAKSIIEGDQFNLRLYVEKMVRQYIDKSPAMVETRIQRNLYAA